MESEIQMSKVPLGAAAYASSLPLGAQAGDSLLTLPLGKLTRRSSTSEYILIWKPYRPSEAKAMRVLSGEMRGGDGDSPEVGDGMLVGTVIVHRPDLLGAPGHVDVVDLGLCDSRGATAEAVDDLVGEAVGPPGGQSLP